MDDAVSFQFTDHKGLIANTVINIPTAQTVANVTAWAQALALDLGAVTGAEVTDIVWTSHIAIPGGIEADHPIAGDDRETGMVLLMDAGQRLNYGVHIPAIQQDKNGGKTVVVDADVIALYTQLVTEVNTITPTDGHGNSLLSFVKATKSTRSK
jgi:hypothetical protein